ncbi:MAG: response regulator [Blastochloris sp.]|nr:response regulator [Blastochloris sp.]
MRILLAEDDMASQQLLLGKLQELGHDVVVTEDGEEAWRLHQEEKFSVVVSDWLMPRLDGVELCKRIRSVQDEGYVYFILETARSGEEDYVMAMDEGVDDFLPKPVDLHELAIRLRVAERIIRYKRHIQELKSLLPICMYCKKIRDDQEYWQQVETYFHEVTGTDFSHGVCPDCYDTILGPEVESDLKATGYVAKNFGKETRSATATADGIKAEGLSGESQAASVSMKRTSPGSHSTRTVMGRQHTAQSSTVW